MKPVSLARLASGMPWRVASELVGVALPEKAMPPVETWRETRDSWPWLAWFCSTWRSCSLTARPTPRPRWTCLRPPLAFVLLVIGIGPIAGLAMMLWNPRAGARLIGVTMAASLLFGLVNHFVVPDADHVAHVVGPSRGLFGATAVPLAITEAAGSVLGIARGWPSARGPA